MIVFSDVAKWVAGPHHFLGVVSDLFEAGAIVDHDDNLGVLLDRLADEVARQPSHRNLDLKKVRVLRWNPRKRVYYGAKFYSIVRRVEKAKA